MTDFQNDCDFTFIILIQLYISACQLIQTYRDEYRISSQSDHFSKALVRKIDFQFKLVNKFLVILILFRELLIILVIKNNLHENSGINLD